MSNIQLNTVEATEQIEICIKSGLVPFLKGSPGIGKSAIIQAIAKKYNLKLIDVRLAQCDPTDLLGFPHIDEAANKATYVPMDMFPVEGDELPEGYDGWFIFMDEMNSADRSVQKAAYKLLLDKMVGNVKLHKKVCMAAAGNLDTDNAIVEELSTALQSRVVHFELVSHAPSWLAWAETARIDHRVQAFIRQFPGKLNTFNPEKSTVEPTYACERTWDFASRICKHVEPNDHAALPVLSGTISQGIAREFRTYCEIYADLPTPEQIQRDPQGVVMPTEPGTLHALSGSCAELATEDNLPKMMQFVNRMPMEFQAITLRLLGRRDRKLLHTPAVADWLAVNNTELF